MDENKREPRLNIVVTPKGVERVSILGGVELTLEAMELYRSIAQDVLKIDAKIKKSGTQSDSFSQTKE